MARRDTDPEVAEFIAWCRREGVTVNGQHIRIRITSVPETWRRAGANVNTCDGAQDTRAGIILVNPKLDARMRLSVMSHEILHWACTVAERVVLLLEPVVLSFVVETILKRYVPYREELARAQAQGKARRSRAGR